MLKFVRRKITTRSLENSTKNQTKKTPAINQPRHSQVLMIGKNENTFFYRPVVRTYAQTHAPVEKQNAILAQETPAQRTLLLKD